VHCVGGFCSLIRFGICFQPLSRGCAKASAKRTPANCARKRKKKKRERGKLLAEARGRRRNRGAIIAISANPGVFEITLPRNHKDRCNRVASVPAHISRIQRN